MSKKIIIYIITLTFFLIGCDSTNKNRSSLKKENKSEVVLKKSSNLSKKKLKEIKSHRNFYILGPIFSASSVYI